MGLFAPPGLFAANALAARGDADLPDGLHLRLTPSPVLGFPLAPFAIYRVAPYLAEPSVVWRSRRGEVLAEPSLEAADGVLYGDLFGPSESEDVRDLAVELVIDGAFDGSIALIDRVENRLFAARSEPPFVVGGPRVERIRISGRGRVTGIRTWRIDAMRVIEPMIGQKPVAVLSLPIDGSRPWYAGGLGPDESFAQVERGAALRLQPPDRPDGPFAPLTPQDDVLRVGAHAAELDKQCEWLVGDIGTPPRMQRRKEQLAASATARQQFVDLAVADTLMVQAMDPGIGRYLGLVGTVNERTDGSAPVALAAVGLFIYSTGWRGPDGRPLDIAFGHRPDGLERVESKLVELFEAQSMLDKLAAKYAVHSWLAVSKIPTVAARALVAVAAAVPPADTPRLEAPILGDGQWLAPQDAPSDAFRQQFLFPAPPLGALVALGRLEGTTWRTRHERIELSPPANPRRRALARLLGRTQPTPAVGKYAVALGTYMRRGVLSDAPIPAGDSPARYRASLADLFGRFGPPIDFDVPAPARPRPPVPAPQLEVVLDGPTGAPGLPASPGHLHVSIVVPPVTTLAAGSLDIVAVDVWFEGVSHGPIAVAVPSGAPATVTADIDFDPLSTGETRSGTLTAKFVDSAGVESEPVSQSVSYADRRQPPVVPTGLGLIWTSRPGPAPDVELKLVWPAAPDTRYRVYVADEKGLAVPGTSRAAVAVEGGLRDRAHTLGGRNHFRLLTEPPLEAAGGRVTLNERLPRALATVQFLRVVPLNAQGREAEFDACGVVPVAVPTDRTPPPPRLQVRVNAASRVATISIAAPGLDLIDLEAAEPGLFTEPPRSGAKAPEFRLRRASGGVNDPIYAREIARGTLDIRREDGEVRFEAEIDDPSPLVSFVRCSYWAEVRMPSERRLAAGVVEVPPPGSIGPASPAQIADMPRPFSPPSAPVSAMHLPPLPVPALAGATVSVLSEAGTVRAHLSAPATPAASPTAIGSYRLRIWEQWGNTSIAAAGPEIAVDGSPLEWDGTPVPDDPSHPRPLKLHVVVLDPVGRESVVTTLTSS
jgi:hypothetical protein